MRDLRLAVITSQHRSLRQAAEAINIRQSTLSRRLRDLEYRLGTMLFERTNGGTRPTVAGMEFFELARRILEDTETALRNLKSRDRGETGRLTIGVYTSMATGNLQATLAEYHRRFPDVDVHTVDGSHTRLISALARSAAKTADEKGRSLEELCSRLFASVHGLTVTGRIRTETEEIDITILNDGNDPRLRREAALILIECKNWTGRCGKNEFVRFKEKLENRSRRSTLGFLVSWNGFAETVTKEMLRGSGEDILIVPVTGEDIRTGVRNGDFARVLLVCWDNAILV
jgi:Bacterial regulatory helix-turn-helix protein, lysR family/Restriction endonuclease